MNVIQKSEAIKNGLRKGFQDGSSKMAKRKCYGYTINSDGELEINPDEAKVVSWIFERYLAGDSLGKIAAGLERQGILSPTGRPKWNREAIISRRPCSHKVGRKNRKYFLEGVTCADPNPTIGVRGPQH